MQNNRIKIYDIDNLPFGTYVTVKTNDQTKRAVVIVNNIASADGLVINFNDIGNMEVYLGW